MDFMIRPTTRTEDLYSYNQSQQLSSQTGCIGHLCADMHTDLNTFLTTWFSRRTSLENEAFRIPREYTPKQAEDFIVRACNFYAHHVHEKRKGECL